MGDFGTGFTFDLGQAFLLKFWTDVCLIASSTAGLIFMLTKFLDAFWDLFVGQYIDKRKPTKNGKYRPVMMVSAVVLSIATVIIFLSPDLSYGAKVAFAAGSYIFWSIWYSLMNIPYGTLGATLTQDPSDRNQLAAYRQAGSIGSLLLTGALFMPIVLYFQDTHVGYFVAALSMSVVGVLSLNYCFRNTKEYILPPPSETVQTREIFGIVKSNKPLLVLIGMMICMITAYNLKIAMMVYFAQYNLQDVALVSIINFVTIGVAVCSTPLIPKIANKFGKKNVVVGGFTISLVADIINFALPSSMWTFLPLATVSFVAFSFPSGVVWALVSDAVDFGEWKTGKRTAGVVYSTFSFSKKLAQSLSGFTAGIGLALVGYVPNVAQTPEALMGIKGLLTLVPAVIVVVATLLVWRQFELTDDKMKAIVDDLHKRNGTAA